MSTKQTESAGDRSNGYGSIGAHGRFWLRSVQWIASPLGELRLAARRLGRVPAFAVSVSTILALTIGMFAATYGVYHHVLADHLPVVNEASLAVLWTERTPGLEVSPPMFVLRRVANASRTMREVAEVAHWGTSQGPFVDGDRTIVLRWAEVSANYFDVLGARPALGRLLLPQDGAPGATPVIVLSFATWKDEFGGNQSVIGRRLRLAYSGTEYFTIVGVAAPGLDYPVGAECWTSLDNRAGPPSIAVARLAPGATVDAARAELLASVTHLVPSLEVTRAEGRTFKEAMVGDARPILTALVVSACLLLVIACLNLAGLFWVRAASRWPEFTIRRALGAERPTLMRPLFAESALVVGSGGILGMFCAAVLLTTVAARLPVSIPRLDLVRIQNLPWGIVLAATAACMLVLGGCQAIAVVVRTRDDSIMVSEASMHGSTSHGQRGRQMLVAIELAIAVVLLVATGLVGSSLRNLETLPLGYRPDGLSVLSIAYDASKYGATDDRATLASAIGNQLRLVHGVLASSPILAPPFLGTNLSRLAVESEDAPTGDTTAAVTAPLEIAGSEYFRTFEIPVMRGRAFDATDNAQSLDVAIISEGLARRLWLDKNPIGRRLRFLPAVTSPLTPARGIYAWRTVVGVVPDVRYRSLRELSAAVYVPWQQYPAWQGFFAVRTAPDASDWQAAARRALRGIDPTLTLWSIESVRELRGAPLAKQRVATLLLSGFSLAAVVLSIAGLFGAMSSVVSQRTREIGIRLALGATPASIRNSVLREGLLVGLCGTVVGLVCAATTTRLVHDLLFGVSPLDPVTLISTCVLLLMACAVAAYVPAHRATRVDPVISLRAE